MTARKRVLKFLIIIILAIFLLSSALISVLYLGGKGDSNGTGAVLSGDNSDVTSQTGALDTGVNDTASVDTGTTNIKTVSVGTVSPIIANTGTK